MRSFFDYNWQVRDEWFAWCKQLSEEDLLKERVGGPKSILYTLFHIIDVEYSWVRAVMGKEDIAESFEEYSTLEKLKDLSDTYRKEIQVFLNVCPDEWTKNDLVQASWLNASFTKFEIGHHIIAHEIHHIGQLSVWSRELGLKPVSANGIGRGLQNI
ncbi:DinB family protein [Bacillus sp. H-16]|uniref:DinB family protein n=1 Tax=Alteribacter salitolerans TaxID=2912333 RepID=UPI0019627B51|nr:DinB family protein [Alteribacter salitolerans]MBM7096239.1 DinB family protein [Alteribacter salitolerans]